MRILNKDIFEIYSESDRLALPELIGLGWCKTDAPRLGGPRTDGRRGYEIGLLRRGSIEWLTEDGLDEAGPGRVVIDWPGDWQGGVNALVHPCERFWVRFNFPPAGRLPGLPDHTIAALEERFERMEVRHFPASTDMASLFLRLLAEQRAPSSFAEEVSRAAFHQILFTAVEDYCRGRRTNFSPAVRRALEIYDAQLCETVRVDDVARAVGLSVGYFYELFVKEIDDTPSAYHMRRRINAAKRALIRSGHSITAVSTEFGFSSSQYFATAFKKVVGLSPAAYRKLREGGKTGTSAPRASVRTAFRPARSDEGS